MTNTSVSVVCAGGRVLSELFEKFLIKKNSNYNINKHWASLNEYKYQFVTETLKNH